MGQSSYEPRADQRQVAGECRGLYEALTQEGFTASEALQIIGTIIAATIQGGTS